eukprot:scaffold4599_cov219-Amphora_coffeaeformis.AAC.18
MKVGRPSLIPEKIRPLVLSPLYLLRAFVKVIFIVAWIVLYVAVVIVAPIPVQQDLLFSGHLLYKIGLAILVVTAVLVPTGLGLQRMQRQVMALLDRVERLVAGDILEAATLAYDLSRGAMVGARDGTLRRAAQSAEAAHAVAQKSRDTSRKAYEATQRGGQAFVHGTGTVVQGTGTVVVASGQAAGRALQEGTHRAADEATHLLQAAKTRVQKIPTAMHNKPKLLTNPKAALKDMGHAVVTNTVNTTQAAARGAVHTGQAAVRGTTNASRFVYESGLKLGHVAVDSSQMAAGSTYRIVQTSTGTILVVASQKVQHAMDNLQKMIQWSPLVIFRRAVKIILKVLVILLLVTTIVLWIAGKVLWKLGIQPSALEALGLSYALAVFVVPVFLYIYWKATRMLNKAGAEMLHKSIEQQKQQAKQTKESSAQEQV